MLVEYLHVFIFWVGERSICILVCTLTFYIQHTSDLVSLLFVSGVILATLIVAWWQPTWGLIYVFLVDNDLNASWGNISPRVWEFLLDFPCVYFKYQLLRVSSQMVAAMYMDSKHNPVHSFSFHPLSQGKIVDFYWSKFSLIKRIVYWLWRDD